jgi:nicotinate-nucleotide adenylyltransferase
MKIALFGGCFNPIHYGHLILAETSREYLNLDQVIFIPAGKPPHKVSDLAPAEDRYQMVKLAIQNNKYFSLSPFELKSKGKSYTYKTINFFKRKYPKDELFFLIGSDTLLEIDTWEKGTKILELCSFIVGMRPGVPTEKVKKEILKKVTVFPLLGLDISSKELREYIGEGKSIKYFVPGNVEEYIYQNRLYGKK